VDNPGINNNGDAVYRAEIPEYFTASFMGAPSIQAQLQIKWD
jgi:hypothetical protein